MNKSQIEKRLWANIASNVAGSTYTELGFPEAEDWKDSDLKRLEAAIRSVIGKMDRHSGYRTT